MKTNAVFKGAYNRCLDLLDGLSPGDGIGSESSLAEALGISRTTVRAVLDGLERAEIVRPRAGQRVLARRPVESERFPEPQPESTAARGGRLPPPRGAAPGPTPVGRSRI